MIFISLIIILIKKDLFNNRLKKILLIISGYLLPLMIFLIYLQSNNLIDDWIIHSKIPSIFIKELDSNLMSLIFNFVLGYFFGSINIYSSSYFILGFVINIVCILFILIYFLKNGQNVDLFFISIFSLLLNFMLVFRHESFRFFCGPVIGIIILFYFINNLKKREYKYLTIVVIIFVSSISNPFEKGNANRIFTNHAQQLTSLKNDNLQKFRKMKYKKDTWHHLKEYNDLLKNINFKCPEINYFYNSTQDHFYYLISTEYFNTFQKIPGYNESITKKYYDSLINVFDDQIDQTLKLEIKNNNVIIIRDENDYDYLKIKNSKINLNNYYKKNLPFSYNNKKKILLIPIRCALN